MAKSVTVPVVATLGGAGIAYLITHKLSWTIVGGIAGYFVGHRTKIGKQMPRVKMTNPHRRRSHA